MLDTEQGRLKLEEEISQQIHNITGSSPRTISGRVSNFFHKYMDQGNREKRKTDSCDGPLNHRSRFFSPVGIKLFQLCQSGHVRHPVNK